MQDNSSDMAFLPQEAFFSKVEERPKGVSDKDIEAFVQTQLENFSPLPLDVLRWGFCANSETLMFFAASADRLSRWKWTAQAMEDAAVVIPLAAALWQCKLDDGWNVVKREMPADQTEYVAVKVVRGGFQSVLACSLASDLPDTHALERFSAMSSEKISADVWRFELLSFKFGRASARISKKAEARDFKIAGNKFFERADVRDTVSLRNAKRKNFYARMGGVLISAAACLFLACLVWQLTFFWQNSRQAGLEETLAVLEPRARSIELMVSESEFLDGINSRKMYNVLMLAQINRVRPEGVTYTKTVATSANTIELRGKAQSVMVLNKFESDLRAADFVKSVDKKISSSQAEGSSWTMNIEFKD